MKCVYIKIFYESLKIKEKRTKEKLTHFYPKSRKSNNENICFAQLYQCFKRENVELSRIEILVNFLFCLHCL